MNYLLDEHPLIILPGLATKIGLNEAIVLQQLHYWCKKKTDTEWVYNTVQQWKEQFPFWSERTIATIFSNLKNQGLVLIEKKNGYDRTNHYRIDYPRYLKLVEDIQPQKINSKSHSAKVAEWNRKGLQDPLSNNCSMDSAKMSVSTTTDTTQKLQTDTTQIATTKVVGDVVVETESTGNDLWQRLYEYDKANGTLPLPSAKGENVQYFKQGKKLAQDIVDRDGLETAVAVIRFAMKDKYCQKPIRFSRYTDYKAKMLAKGGGVSRSTDVDAIAAALEKHKARKIR